MKAVKEAGHQPVDAEDHGPTRAHKALMLYLRQGGRLGPMLVALVCLVFLMEALRLPFGSLGEPGPGLWPTGIIVLTLGACLLAAIVVREIPKLTRREGAVRSGTYILLLALFWPFYDLLGFIPAASILCIVLFKFIGKEKWLTSILVAVIGSTAVYLLFGVLLELRITPIVGF